MITTKQRAKLRAMAQTLPAMVHIGKDGLTDEVINEIVLCISKNELIKIKVLTNGEESPKQVLQQILEKLNVEPVSVIGFNIVLYSRSKRQDVRHIELD